jgi:glycosyltransferase involved in cell wall biosynthesis
MPSLLVQVSVTENDFSTYKASLLISLQNILKLVQFKVKILMVYQSKNSEEAIDEFFLSPEVILHRTTLFGVSAARNTGLKYARSEGYDYIIFHDASLSYSEKFVDLINLTISQNMEITKGKMQWVAEADTNRPATLHLSKKKTNPIFDPYIGTYVFRVSALTNMAFNEKMGPGESTLMIAGEDLLFLYQLFEGRIPFIVDYSEQAIVEHPTRPSDNSKQLAYAESQGVLLRWLLMENRFNLTICIYFFAFFGNSIFGVLAGRTAATKVFSDRVKGFLDFAGIRKIL